MAADLRICLFDEVHSESAPLDQPFRQIEGLEIVDTVSAWETLHACLIRGSVDVVAVNLDGETGLDIVHRIAKLPVECPIIGVSSATDSSFIIGAMRAGCAQYVCWPIDREDLTNALQRIRPRLKTAHSSKRICVVGSSGGAGATTIACNLAIELAHLTERRTALVDMNLEYGDVCCAFDCTPKYTIADICCGDTEIDHDTLGAALHELPCNISILARPERVEDARDVTPEGIEQMLGMLSESFSHVVVDMPRGHSFLGAVGTDRAASILIVAQLAVPFIRNATRIYQCLAEMGVNEERIQIVLNRCNADFERITVKDVEEHFNRPIFGIIPNDYQFVSAALDLGHPIGADAPASRARSAIREMAKKLAPEYVRAGSPDANAGFLGKLLRRKQKQE